MSFPIPFLFPSPRDLELPLKGPFMIYSTTGISNNHVIVTRYVASLPCVCNNKPAAPQGYYRRQSPLNIHQALLLAHTHVCTHTHTHRWSSYTTMLLWSKRAHYLPVVVLQSSAEITNQSKLSELGSLSACLSTPSPLAGNTLTDAHLIPFLSPNVDSRVCSERALWLH